jgi:hypothetical protein
MVLVCRTTRYSYATDDLTAAIFQYYTAGKPISPPLECSMFYKGPPGWESLPISPEFISNNKAVFAF